MIASFFFPIRRCSILFKSFIRSILRFAQFRTGAIPVGIAVARQRLQAEHAQQHQQKEINRFSGIGITDLGKFFKYYIQIRNTISFHHNKNVKEKPKNE